MMADAITEAGKVVVQSCHGPDGPSPLSEQVAAKRSEGGRGEGACAPHSVIS